MSLRKRACASCVAAKRKCDLAFPTCHRCAQRSVACRYPYPPLTNSQQDEDALYPAEPANSTTAGNLDNIWALVDDFSLSPTEPSPEPLWPVSFDRRILEFYPRVEDHATWQFCVTTLLTQIDAFLHHGTAFFMHPSADSRGDLPPPLRAAYGVCAAHKLRKESALPFAQQLLETEVDGLIARRPPAVLQDGLAELCAILLYYIIAVFGGTAVTSGLAEQIETLLALRTVHVESLELATRQSTATLVEVGLVSADEARGLWHACDSARKVVVVSYLAREIRHVLRWKTCYLLRQIVALPVSKPYVDPPDPGDSTGPLISTRWRDVVTYDQFVRDWEAGELRLVDEFAYLLISACKGVGAM
ncbi:hypothetical protein HFD88_005430 [Aspergillus terreus]|nr:hypothetical protein HFD88_005430 [Aspergillus terreus]